MSDIKEVLFEIYPNCWARCDNIRYPNKPYELRKIIKDLTGEDLFVLNMDDKYKLFKEDKFQITGDLIENYPQCCCSCLDCSKQWVIEYIPTGIKFCVGSVCIRNFKSKRLNSQLGYAMKNKRCIICDAYLVFKNNNAQYSINTKQSHKICIKCENSN